LAWYAIKQVRTGRRVGSRLNIRDVLSPANRRVVVQHWQDDGWQEVLVEDRHARPAETAAARIDVAAWFRSLSRKKRRVVRKLAQGETTGSVARMFGLPAGRVSQLRRELAESWEEFQGEPVAV
jgi:hypothetical protein